MAVYEGIWNIITRNFPKAAELFLMQVDTFNAPEIIEFDRLVYYGCILGVVTLSRKEIKNKIINNSEIIAVLREDSVIYDFVFSFYDAHYDQFFDKLVILVEKFLSKDEFIKTHREYILKLLRIAIYTQYLEAFKTVTIQKMASDFKVSPEFIDRELSELISKHKIKAQIDKVSGVVDSSKGDTRIEVYNEIIRKGDHLIERMHKLMRLANI